MASLGWRRNWWLKAGIMEADHPPSLRVKNQWYVWQEGKAILFDDTHCHEVVNKGMMSEWSW